MQQSYRVSIQDNIYYVDFFGSGSSINSVSLKFPTKEEFDRWREGKIELR